MFGQSQQQQQQFQFVPIQRVNTPAILQTQTRTETRAPQVTVQPTSTVPTTPKPVVPQQQQQTQVQQMQLSNDARILEQQLMQQRLLSEQLQKQLEKLQQQQQQRLLPTTPAPTPAPVVQTVQRQQQAQPVPQFQVPQQQLPQQTPQFQVPQQQLPQTPQFQVPQQQLPQFQPTRPVQPMFEDFCRNAQPGDLIAHPRIQSQFIICYGFGEFTIMDCPEHLVYNPFLQRCDLHTEEPLLCKSNPCMNKGRCVELGDFDYRCECPAGFSGMNCERVDSCASRPCGADGQCITLSSGSPFAHVCLCNGGRSLGQTCQQTEMNPCLQPNSNMRMFPLRMGSTVFAHCEGTRPHLKFCQAPLVFSAAKQACDWM